MATEYEDDNAFIASPPAHPVAQLQGPFEESMVESVNDFADLDTNLDSVARRTMLLEKPKYERVIAGRWKQKPGERYHPLWKITAQMSFGMHLLAEGMCRSEEEVMRILQSHVDDIDGFLERTTEDFDLAQEDVQERLRYLKLPLEHVEVFDRMLEDRTFRMSIVDGNEKIEHIVDRTSEAMKDSLKDVKKGMEATRALDKYLSDLDGTWARNTAEHEAVFMAMLGNVEGWSRAFMDLYLQGNKLGKSLVQLSEIVAEMQRRAGEVSRRMLIRPQSTTAAIRQSTTSATRHSHQAPKAHYSRRQEELRGHSRPTSTATTKALPTAPETRSAARHSARSALPRQSPSTEKQAMVHSRGSSQSHVDKTGSRNSASTPPSGNSRSSSSMQKHLTISELAGNDAVPRNQPPPQVQPRIMNTTPMELPAEVPEQVLSQAPHSNKSRWSMALGLKNRDTSENRSSLIMTTKSLGALLKTPLSARLSMTPRSTGSKDTTSSEATSNVKLAESSTDYFGAQALQQSGSTDSQAQVLQPAVYQANQGLRIQGIPGAPKSDPKLTLGRLAFNSHPPEMMLGEKPILPGNGLVKPVELPSGIPSAAKEEQKQHSRHESHLSSLGEPGPEIDVTEASEPEAPEPQPADRPQASTFLDVIARRTLLSSGQPSLNAQISSNGGSATGSGLGNDNAAPGSYVAEMEGSSPMLLAPLTFGGPAELEAPQQRLILPPRPEASNKPIALASATITSQDDFFKLPAFQHADPLDVLDNSNRVSKQVETRRAPGYASMPVQSFAKSMGNVREERISLPSRLSGLKIPRKEAPVLSRNRSDLIEHISYTPPESPIHARSVSEASSNSARIMIERPSRSLAPPKEAPPPPGPGGRSMANPDYAAAGAFEGERRSKHSSGGSGSSWKRLLGGNGTTPLISPSATASRPGSSSLGSHVSSDARTSGVNMLTSGGKDVLWFKGMNRDGAWVSSEG